MKTADIADQLIGISIGMKGVSENLIVQLQQLKKDDWKALWNYAGQQQIWGIIYEALKKLPHTVQPDKDVISSFLKMRENLLYQYYSMLSFTTIVTDILQKSNIDFYVLKGVTLDSLYPFEGIRPISDVDLLVPDRKQFERACKALEKNGFSSENEVWDYHKTYYKNNGSYRTMLEMHIRPASRMSADLSSEQKVVHRFEKLLYKPDYYKPAGIEIPGLPVEECALQLILHMMNHCFGNDMSLNLLCDWAVFWHVKGHQIDIVHFNNLLKESGTENFAKIITGICMASFGLSPQKVRWMHDSERMYDQEKMLRLEIDEKKQYVERKKNVNVLFLPGESLLIGCIREVHRQMKYCFPRGRKIFFIWPVLWIWTILFFLSNNRKFNRGSIWKIIMDAKKRESLLREMGLTGRGKK